ncbi:RsmB/NOP family class I SAM-dependent RNA methyltransferase [Paracoccus aerodenitrificans]|uniref:RsmB/NOP family class I SAM-dependent RNA methyltransferase n=1 Tax=Paracoccus aerodenitrificans TaxID=3017781 RepID=UPI0022F131E8|nr:RsmB/NOP family class I SAM-dependent RNA methyltransferase [Paracoccus aerodenitrificans]WBU64992.1 RsmB/NOP family class I SAM-dependent RNA methyltransferase [Paracoccus aerodenitrificans]
MRPAARVAAAIGILDDILAGSPAEQALIRWARASRFAGSGDRAAIRDLVFEALRRRDSLAALGGGPGGRGLMLGLLRLRSEDPAGVFTGERHAPEPLGEAEKAGGTTPAEADRLGDMPDWIWQHWQASLGSRALPLAHMMRERAPVWLRVNSRLSGPEQACASLLRDGITAKEDPRLAGALLVTDGERRINASEAYRTGLVELQDLSPQLACASLPLKQGARVLDYCAGGGGKSLALAAREDLRITAHDAAPSRMADLPERAKRAGVSIRIETREKLGGDYDLVVADVPCSGSGTWRRTPDSKWRIRPEDLRELLATQAQILSQSAALTGPGGFLAYMTCSLLDVENGDQIDAFMTDNPEFSEQIRSNWTPLEASDGFFLSLLKRRQ